jgi:phosphoketolase
MNSTPSSPRNKPSSVSLERYTRAAHYLAGAQIYLRENTLLREPLRAEQVKDRLLGTGVHVQELISSMHI